MKRILLLCSAGLLLAALVGCSSTGKRHAQLPRLRPTWPTSATTMLVATNELHPELLRPSNAPFTLGPGDRLEIELLGTPNSRAVTSVGPDGKIYYYLLPGMDVWGLTLAETRDRLQKEAGKIRHRPPAHPHAARGRQQTRLVAGPLDRPGVYPMAAPMTLLEAIAQAGGTANSGEHGYPPGPGRPPA